MRQDWMLIRRVKGGHSYWRRANDSAIGVSDSSGTYPENCERSDNPPLLLDRRRPITMGTGSCFVPLTNALNEISDTVTSGFEALWVATQFNMEIEAIEHAGAVPLRCALTQAAESLKTKDLINAELEACLKAVSDTLTQSDNEIHLRIKDPKADDEDKAAYRNALVRIQKVRNGLHG